MVEHNVVDHEDMWTYVPLLGHAAERLGDVQRGEHDFGELLHIEFIERASAGTWTTVFDIDGCWTLAYGSRCDLRQMTRKGKQEQVMPTKAKAKDKPCRMATMAEKGKSTLAEMLQLREDRTLRSSLPTTARSTSSRHLGII